ncbi:MAG TPA: hypothetical protein VLC06_19860 [Polyangia bacterium]|jgi:hypothetical protein|nr:hypothetical protein [Polyangia bacterium]
MATPDETIDAAWKAVFGTLAQLRERWPSTEWMYDRRLRCVASSIPLAGAVAARAAFAEALPGAWSTATLASAPASVQALAETCGGLRASQELLWGGDADGPGAFGLWWPWGDGTTVTLRIGLHGLDQPKVRYPQLRDVFGIPQAPGPA